MLRRRLAPLLAALLLAAPAPALAQSAGDDQYEDPFAGQNEQPAPTPTPAPATPAPTAEPGQAPPAEPAPAPAPASSGQPEELPRTGLDAGAVVALGVLLLASGAVLRLRLRERA